MAAAPNSVHRPVASSETKGCCQYAWSHSCVLQAVQRRLHTSHKVKPRRWYSQKRLITSEITARSSDLHVDVAVVGSGIIGLSVAYTLLKNSTKRLSVALVDRKGLCAGATGAGQGYIWLAHRPPSGPMWDLVSSSKQQWSQWVPDLATINANVKDLAPPDWQVTGSILLATTAGECTELEQRCAALNAMGVDAVCLTSAELRSLEPAVELTAEGGGLRVPMDAQLNGVNTAKQLLAACKTLGNRQLPGSFHVLFDTHVASLLQNEEGRVIGIQTQQGSVTAELGVVVASGAWTGQLLSSVTGDGWWDEVFKPRRGHLLELPARDALPRLHHGLMETQYSKHYAGSTREAAAEAAVGPSDIASSSGSVDGGCAADVVFTATSTAYGSLLVGSSREFSGWENTADASVVQSILDRGTAYLPGLGKADLAGMTTRVGLRPYVKGGTPMVGPVPGHEGLYIAAGHEGSGLTLGPITAHIIQNYILSHDDMHIPAAAHWLPENIRKATS